MPLDHDPGPDDLEAWAAQLRSLEPARPVSRDEILFRAGQAAARRRGRGLLPSWPSVAAGLAAAVLGEAALVATRPEPRVIERVVFVDRAAPAITAAPIPAAPRDPGPPASPVRSVELSPRARATDQIARFGLDALTDPVIGSPPSRQAALSGRDLLRHELHVALHGDRS